MAVKLPRKKSRDEAGGGWVKVTLKTKPKIRIKRLENKDDFFKENLFHLT
jgi:hypothetical protein